MTDVEAWARWLIRRARQLNPAEEWSVLYDLEIALLRLACAAPLEDGRWTRLAFDIECRLGELEADERALPATAPRRDHTGLSG